MKQENGGANAIGSFAIGNFAIGNFADAVEYIYRIPRFTAKHTLRDTGELLQKLGSPDRRFKIIHVAGTNGKGSVCAYLYSLLKKAGYRTCLFTSPHLRNIRERFVLNGEMVSEEAFLKAFMRVYEVLPRKDGEILQESHPSFFEYLFLMGMLLFADADAEYCVLETGLGGRLDATNSIGSKEIAVITHLGLDHTEYLGNTLTEIAGEKAGIMQNAARTLFWETDSTVSRVLAEKAKNLQIPSFSVSKEDYTFLKFHHKGIDFSYHSLYYDSIDVHLSSVAAYQMENATLALRCMELLFPREKLPVTVLRDGVTEAFWPGRMEEIEEGLYLDGAHNEDGIRAFLETVRQDGACRRRLFLGVVEDKDYNRMVKEIADSGLFEEISSVQLGGTRALPVSRLQQTVEGCTGKPCRAYPNAAAALKAARLAVKEADRVYIAGSLYLVGEIKEQVHD